MANNLDTRAPLHFPVLKLRQLIQDKRHPLKLQASLLVFWNLSIHWEYANEHCNCSKLSCSLRAMLIETTEAQRALIPGGKHWPGGGRRAPPGLSPNNGDLAGSGGCGPEKDGFPGVGRSGGGLPTTGVFLPWNEGWSLLTKDSSASKPGKMKKMNVHQKSAAEASELPKEQLRIQGRPLFFWLRGFYDQRVTGC